MTMPAKWTAIAALALLAACGRQEGRGGLTADEERQLDDAAKMLDDNMIDVSGDTLSDNEAQLTQSTLLRRATLSRIEPRRCA